MRAGFSLLFILWAAAALAQQQATLTGTVSDNSGALVPGVSITLRHPESGEAYRATSNEIGSYTIPFIKPGTYQLEAQARGFKKYTQSNLRLDTAAHTRADIRLEVGEVNETVTVQAEAPLLKTENSSVGVVIQNKTIASMPLLGRRAAQLVRLSGFVVQRGEGSQFQIAGGRSDNAMWTLDGGSSQNILLGVATLNFDPPIEALEEMNVEVSNYKAEMGRTGGGFIQMTTKSGTNSLHGALYEYLRNDAFDARQFFAASKQTLRRNQFGFALGGPIRKNRTFFFGSYEWTPQTTSSPSIQNVPDLRERAGDFSNVRGLLLRDPVTRQPVPGNVIPQSQIDPVGRQVAQFWPEPNIAGRPSRDRNFIGLAANKSKPGAMTARIDHTINDRHRMFGRYVHNLNRQFPIRDSHVATNWTQVRSRHTVKWGGEYRQSRNDDENLPTAGGVMNFNNNAAGDPVAALLYGWVASASRQQTFLIRSRMNSLGLYLQDDWKPTPKLTLNLGLRYDLDTPRFEAIDNRQNSFDMAAINPVCNCAGRVTWSGRDARGGSKYAHNFATRNFGPRLGFAYRAGSS